MKQQDDWHLTDTIRHELGKGDPFAAAVRATRMAMVITDPQQNDNPIVFCNEAFQKLSGYSREEIIGRNCRFLQGKDTDREQIARVRAAILDGCAIDIDLLNYRKDGSTFWNALYLSPVRNNSGAIQFFFASQLDVTQRVDARNVIDDQRKEMEIAVERRTADLQAALEAKTLLLHEVDHRVKNNLTMIGSLLRLQARSIRDPTVTAKLGTMLERVDALAAVHKRLYNSVDVTKFDAGQFAADLAADVLGASGRSDIKLVAQVEKIEVSSSKASALGLVLNEVLTNAIKHAFPESNLGQLAILTKVEKNLAYIIIDDNGRGVGSGIRKMEGLGHTLIKRLSLQIGATTTWTPLSPGTRVAISLPMEH